ncbi:MAG: DUF1887 family protein [Mediterranea sp.]|nr:DUF1887 family protein [Mediterranea sp.]
MKHIHIALIGGQIYPVYLGIADEQPDKVILVHSEESKPEAKRIKQEVERNLQAKVLSQSLSPVDVPQIFHQIQALSEQIITPDNAYTINLTSGTKPWSIAFYHYFSPMPNVKLIYIDQNGCISDLKTLESRLSKVGLDMDLIFRLNGTPSIVEYEKISDGRLEKCPIAKELLAKWFERYIAKLLYQWKWSKEVRLNVKFPYSEQAKVKNEIDVIVNSGNRLLFVECKSGGFSPIDVDKFRTVVKNYGGMACKALFITYKPMTQEVLEKCADSGIVACSIADHNKVPGELYQMLEEELFKINKK